MSWRTASRWASGGSSARVTGSINAYLRTGVRRVGQGTCSLGRKELALKRLAAGALAVALAVGAAGCGGGEEATYIATADVERDLRTQVQDNIDASSNAFQRGYRAGQVACREIDETRLSCQVPLLHDDGPDFNDDLYYEITRGSDGSWSAEEG